MAGQNFNQANTAATDNGTKVFKAFYAPADVSAPEAGNLGMAPAPVYSLPTVTLWTQLSNLPVTGTGTGFGYKVPAGDWVFIGAECVKTSGSGDVGDEIKILLAEAGDISNPSTLVTFDLSGSAVGQSVVPLYSDFSAPVLGSRGDALGFAVDAGSGSAPNTAAYVTVKLGMLPKPL